MFIEKQPKYTIEYAVWLSSHWKPFSVGITMLKPWYSNVILSWTCCMDGNQNFIYSFLNRRSLTAIDRLLRSDSTRLSRGVSSRKLISTSRSMIASHRRTNLCKLREITQPDAFIIYLLTLSWMYSPRKAAKFRSDHSTSTWKSWLDQSPVSRKYRGGLVS